MTRLGHQDFHRIAAGVLYDGRRVLLGHRHPDRLWFPNVWDLPGGHVEIGETPAEALARELHEELGIKITTPTVTPTACIRLASDTEMSVWVVRSWAGEVENRAPDEHDDLRWFHPRDVASLDLADRVIVDLCSAAI